MSALIAADPDGRNVLWPDQSGALSGFIEIRLGDTALQRRESREVSAV